MSQQFSPFSQLTLNVRKFHAPCLVRAGKRSSPHSQGELILQRSCVEIREDPPQHFLDRCPSFFAGRHSSRCPVPRGPSWVDEDFHGNLRHLGSQMSFFSLFSITAIHLAVDGWRRRLASLTSNTTFTGFPFTFTPSSLLLKSASNSRRHDDLFPRLTLTLNHRYTITFLSDLVWWLPSRSLSAGRRSGGRTVVPLAGITGAALFATGRDLGEKRSLLRTGARSTFRSARLHLVRPDPANTSPSCRNHVLRIYSRGAHGALMNIVASCTPSSSLPLSPRWRQLHLATGCRCVQRDLR